MNKPRIGITTECMCDLPRYIIRENDIGILRFYVVTETGIFRDGDEISSKNVTEYFQKGGGALVTEEAPIEEYVDFFREWLDKYDELIHITISSGASHSFERAKEACARLGDMAKRIRLVDSCSLSSGMAFLVLKAVKLRDDGETIEKTVRELEDMRGKLCVSFISKKPDQMFRNGLMSKAANRLCSILQVHPIFSIKKGKVSFSGFCAGKMQGAAKRYIRRRLRRANAIDTSRLFITHTGYTLSEIDMLRKEVARRLVFDTVTMNEASATVAGNCGSETFGLMFMKKG